MADWRASAEMRGPSTMESSSKLRDKSAEGPTGYKNKLPENYDEVEYVEEGNDKHNHL